MCVCSVLAQVKRLCGRTAGRRQSPLTSSAPLVSLLISVGFVGEKRLSRHELAEAAEPQVCFLSF